MESFKINSYRNFFVFLFLFFIPFNYALTFNIGFPLKISEISLLSLLLILLIARKLKVESKVIPVFNSLVIFLALSLISLIINFFWSYNYSLDSYEARFGYKLDSLLKFGYVILAIFCFLIAYKIFSTNQKYGLKIYLMGAIVASLYTWYLFVSSLLNWPVFLLPGMDTDPQRVLLSFGSFIRSGTFKEGNFMGMYLLLSGIIAFYCRKIKLGIFLFLGIIPTVSSIAFLNCIVFLLSIYFKKYFTRKYLPKLFLLFVGFIIIFILSLGNKDFKYLVTSKFFGNTKEISNNSEYSKADRINSMMTALRVGLHNPILGVGISNFGLHQKEYLYDSRFYKTEKSIPNNIYLEIFAEQGIITTLVFLFFLRQIYVIAKQEQATPLKYGLIVTYIYFIAFPTYSILFLWIYLALIVSLNNINLYNSNMD